MSQLSFRDQLEKHNQPEEVRQRLAAGQYGKPHDTIAQEYLDSIDRKESAKAASLRDAREEETLAIAKAAAAAATVAAASATDANTIARSNSRRIWRSEIIAAVAAIAAIVAAYAAIKGIK